MIASTSQQSQILDLSIPPANSKGLHHQIMIIGGGAAGIMKPLYCW